MLATRAAKKPMKTRQGCGPINLWTMIRMQQLHCHTFLTQLAERNYTHIVMKVNSDTK